jgi:aryl-alcohol dehydrogenase-like predicted oxidoreductase
MAKLGNTELDVFGLCLGGNVFSWSADEDASFEILDAYTAAGGNFIDTADTYTRWVAGHVGGESEAILGRWMKARGTRDAVVLATKVGKKPDRRGLSAANIRTAAEESLTRLGTDYIDLYYARADDPDVPLEEALGAFDTLIREGKVRHVAASNFSAPRLAESLAVSEREGFARYAALQNEYNLLERSEYESSIAPLLEREGIAGLPYYGLARGFLAGKYRPGVEVDSVRAGGVAAYRNERGYKLLEALDQIAAAHGTSDAAVALAWLAAQPAVAAPVASASNVQQLVELLQFTELRLSADELALLNAVSA